MKVCIGGTFDNLHKGHMVLIDKAIDVAGENGFLFIGLTKNKITNKKTKIEKYDKRKQNLTNFLEKKQIKTKIKIRPINDKFGPSITDDFDAIIVSPETKNTAEEINKIRKKNNKKLLKIISIPYVLSEKGKPICSTSIRKKEIDKKGRILKK